jgi:glycosyltransferase involved in cell wall biosynthesis
MNGVDLIETNLIEAPSSASDDAVVVLFLGKLEPEKGALEFAEAFIAASQKDPRLHAQMIGSGSLAERIDEAFDEAGIASRVTRVERLPHKSVLATLRSADIYVSLNRFGNLSNANLEAMRIGICMIIPAAQIETKIDLITEALLPDDAAYRISSARAVGELADSLVMLAADVGQRRRMAAAARKAAETFLMTWDERVRQELEILEAIGAGN